MARSSIILAVAETSVHAKACRALATARDLAILARTSNLMETFTAVEELQPDAVLISRAMTLFPEFEVMRGLFKAMKVRWIILEGADAGTTRGRDPHQLSDLFPINLDRPTRDILLQLSSVLRLSDRPSSSNARQRMGGSSKCLLIGASTGGVDALVQLLIAFPALCPPTFIVQHTGSGFGSSLVRLLDRQCSAKVVQARDGLIVGMGTVCIGAGLDGHMVLSPGAYDQVEIQTGKPISGHIPSVDALFHSAQDIGRQVVAVLLTGMGRDGAEGLLALRNAGARTIAQDEATSVVYGMPKVAAELGAAEFQLPLGKIANKALQLCNLPARI